jgi:hypothetical protein
MVHNYFFFLEEFKTLVYNQGLAYPRGYTETSYGVCKIENNILFRDQQ